MDTFMISTPPRHQFVTILGAPTPEQRIDEADASTTYIGQAAAGVATSLAQWQIRKISVSSGVTTIAWADGNNNYDNVWDDRASLSYS